MIGEGDIIEVPIPDARLAHGWVVLVSKYFKDTVGFMILGIDGTVLSPDIESGRRATMLGLFYTHIDNLSAYKCKTVGHVPLSAAHKAVLTTRTCGGGVWVGDEYSRPADNTDYAQLKEMTWIGMPNVFKEIDKALTVSHAREPRNQSIGTGANSDADFFRLEFAAVYDLLIEALRGLGYIRRY